MLSGLNYLLRKTWSGVGLQRRLAIALGLLLLIAASVQAHLTIRSAANGIKSYLVQELDNLLPLLTPLVAEQVVIGDFATIRQMLGVQAAHRLYIERIIWTNPRGLTLEVPGYKTETIRPQWFADYLNISLSPSSQHIVLGGVDYGMFTISVTTIPAENLLWGQFVNNLWQLFLIIFLVFIITSIVLRRNLIVVKNLVASSQRLSRGEYDVRIPAYGSPEMRTAAHAFNDMASKISDLITTLSVNRYDMREQLHFTQELIEAIPIPVFFKDHNGRFMGVNKSWESFFKLSREKVVGYTTQEVFVDNIDFAKQQSVQDVNLFSTPGTLSYETSIVDENDIQQHVVFYQATYTKSDGKVAGMIGIIVDVTERKLAQDKLTHMAYYDSLTGLPSRPLLIERLRQAIAVAEHRKCIVAVLYLDLDKFKYINDTLGHDVGDMFLELVAKHLGKQMRPNDTLSRFGGDEFTILLTNIDDEHEIGLFAQFILESFRTPFHIANRDLFVTPSIGIAIFPYDDDSAEDLIKNADVAMYHAKEAGGATYQFYKREMNTRTARRLSIETALRFALERGEIMLYYQPQVDLASGKMCAAEALLRWESPTYGFVPPDEFIPIAEQNGLILPIGEWALTMACYQAQIWNSLGLGSIRVAVNLSSRQLQQGHLRQHVMKALEKSGLDPQLLELELTESMLIGENETTRDTFAELDKLGIRFSVDDFGTGYSSLSYLKIFPIDAVKVDRSFLRGVPSDPNSVAIAAAIIAMAQSLEIDVVAEGVETIEQIDFLRSHRCESMQGYLFSKAIPANEFIALIKEGRQLPVAHRASVLPIRPRI